MKKYFSNFNLDVDKFDLKELNSNLKIALFKVLVWI